MPQNNVFLRDLQFKSRKLLLLAISVFTSIYETWLKPFFKPIVKQRLDHSVRTLPTLLAVSSNKAISSALKWRGSMGQRSSNYVEKLVADLKNDSRYRNTMDGKPFFQVYLNPDGGGQTILFVSPVFTNTILASLKDIYVDGTFCRVPGSFQCLLTIFVEYQGQVFPFAYALMTRKNTVSYEAVFRKLQDLYPNFSPQLAITDYENTLFISLKNVFSTNLRVTWSYYHFCHVIWRNVMRTGLSQAYKTNTSAKITIKMMMATALLPAHLFARCLPIINTEISTAISEDYELEPLNQLLRYFVSTWLTTRNPYDVCVITKRNIKRTNNYVESFHKLLISKLGPTLNPISTHFLEKLSEIENEFSKKFVAMKNLNPDRVIHEHHQCLATKYTIVTATEKLRCNQYDIEKFLLSVAIEVPEFDESTAQVANSRVPWTSPQELNSGVPRTRPHELNSGVPRTRPHELNSGVPRTRPQELNYGVPRTSPQELNSGVSRTSPRELNFNVPRTGPREFNSGVPRTAPREFNSNLPGTSPRESNSNVPRAVTTDGNLSTNTHSQYNRGIPIFIDFPPPSYNNSNDNQPPNFRLRRTRNTNTIRNDTAERTTTQEPRTCSHPQEDTCRRRRTITNSRNSQTFNRNFSSHQRPQIANIDLCSSSEDDISEIPSSVINPGQEANSNQNKRNDLESPNMPSSDDEISVIEQDLSKNTNPDKVCQICFSAQQNCVFLNCGHFAMCMPCGRRIFRSPSGPRCPFCREVPVGIQQLYGRL